MIQIQEGCEGLGMGFVGCDFSGRRAFETKTKRKRRRRKEGEKKREEKEEEVRFGVG